MYWNTWNHPGWHRNVGNHWIGGKQNSHICLNICRNMLKKWCYSSLPVPNLGSFLAECWRWISQLHFISLIGKWLGKNHNDHPKTTNRNAHLGFAHFTKNSCTSPARFWASFSSFLAFCQAVFAQSAWDLCSAKINQKFPRFCNE